MYEDRARHPSPSTALHLPHDTRDFAHAEIAEAGRITLRVNGHPRFEFPVEPGDYVHVQWVDMDGKMRLPPPPSPPQKATP